VSIGPNIQYVRTADGVSIAYFRLGEGDVLPPVVFMDAVYSHLQVEWDDAEQRQQYEAIARITTLVRYDHRGFGLSDRDGVDLSLDGLVLDLEAVVARAVPDRPFVLIAERGVTTPIAVTYAVRHPERLTHLVLTTPASRLPKAFIQQVDALLSSPTLDERFFSEALARLAQGWDDHDASRAMAARMRASVSLDGFRAFFAEMKRWDVRGILPDVRTPTLLTPYKGYPLFGEEHAREIATLLPGARVSIIDGSTSAERGANLAAAVADFVSGGRLPAPTLAPAVERRGGTAIILFTDIVDSTALTERLGDTVFRAASRTLDEGMRTAIRDAGGTPVEGKVLGDGVMGVFTSASEAIVAARRCIELSAESELLLHVGLHAGDVLHEAGNVYGGAVNIASRICGMSAPGEILVSATIRELARTSSGVTFADRGEHALKGISDAVRLYEVRWRVDEASG
jgi:class 3 adenylate cyclase